MTITTERRDLRDRARRRIDKGELPAEHSGRTYGCKGNRKHCSLCGETIEPEDTELQFDSNADRAVITYQFHLGCFDAWQLESK